MNDDMQFLIDSFTKRKQILLPNFYIWSTAIFFSFFRKHTFVFYKLRMGDRFIPRNVKNEFSEHSSVMKMIKT